MGDWLPPPDREALEVLARRAREDHQIALLRTGARRPRLSVDLFDSRGRRLAGHPVPDELRIAVMALLEADHYPPEMVLRRRRHRERMVSIGKWSGR